MVERENIHNSRNEDPHTCMCMCFVLLQHASSNTDCDVYVYILRVVCLSAQVCESVIVCCVSVCGRVWEGGWCVRVCVCVCVCVCV